MIKPTKTNTLMNKQFFKITYLIPFILNILFVSCSTPSKEQLIIGEWQFQAPKEDTTGYKKNEVFVFFKNNVFWHGYKSGKTVNKDVIGDYSLKENGKFLEVAPAEGFGVSKNSTEIIELTNEILVLKAKFGTENLILKKISMIPN